MHTQNTQYTCTHVPVRRGGGSFSPTATTPWGKAGGRCTLRRRPTTVLSFLVLIMGLLAMGGGGASDETGRESKLQKKKEHGVLVSGRCLGYDTVATGEGDIQLEEGKGWWGLFLDVGERKGYVRAVSVCLSVCVGYEGASPSALRLRGGGGKGGGSPCGVMTWPCVKSTYWVYYLLSICWSCWCLGWVLGFCK